MSGRSDKELVMMKIINEGIKRFEAFDGGQYAAWVEGAESKSEMKKELKKMIQKYENDKKEYSGEKNWNVAEWQLIMCEVFSQKMYNESCALESIAECGDSYLVLAQKVFEAYNEQQG